jgi:hypothetical protein
LRGDKELSTNFYLHGTTEEDYTGIRSLAAAKVSVKSHVVRHGSTWEVSVDLKNVSAVPALMVNAKVVREKSGDPILPAFFDDNYIALMPGERRAIHIELNDADTRGERARAIVGGFNLAPRPM